MIRRSVTTLTIVGALLLAGCAPEPAPTPTPTGFASEEEAFAAAEATYRAYVDASNAYRQSPTTATDPSILLTGEALSAELEARAEMNRTGLRLEGMIAVAQVRAISSDAQTARIGVCLDVTDTRVLDSQGEDVTPSDRSNLLGLEVEAAWVEPRPLLSSTIASDAEC